VQANALQHARRRGAEIQQRHADALHRYQTMMS
jgi:hypothetical protein